MHLRSGAAVVLAADSDPEVAKFAEARLSCGPDPAEYQFAEEPVDLNRPPIKH
jgi:hypothetical protein